MAGRTKTNRVSFTKSFLQKVTCPDGKDRAYWYDRRTPGLALCVTATGGKTFYIIRRVHGRPRRMRLGRFPDVSVASARRKAAIVNSQIAEGGDPATAMRTARGEPTFAELFSLFMENHAKPHKRTWAEDQAQFDRYLSHWAGRKLSRITKADVVALHNSLGREHPYTANRVLGLLSTLFNKAQDLVGWGGANPSTGIKKFPERARDRFLAADELPRFFDALTKETETFREFFMLALLTGARRGNLQAMRWEEISLEQGVWRIPDTKTGEPVTVPLCQAARRILEDRKQRGAPESLWVFPAKTQCGHLTYPTVAWQRVVARAGLKNLRIHDLRRTLGSWQAATGASLPVIGKTLGHKRQETTAIYARLSLDPVRAAVNVATDAILAAGGYGATEEQPPASNQLWKFQR